MNSNEVKAEETAEIETAAIDEQNAVQATTWGDLGGNARAAELDAEIIQMEASIAEQVAQLSPAEQEALSQIMAATDSHNLDHDLER